MCYILHLMYVRSLLKESIQFDEFRKGFIQHNEKRNLGQNGFIPHDHPVSCCYTAPEECGIQDLYDMMLDYLNYSHPMSRISFFTLGYRQHATAPCVEKHIHSRRYKEDMSAAVTCHASKQMHMSSCPHAG